MHKQIWLISMNNKETILLFWVKELEVAQFIIWADPQFLFLLEVRILFWTAFFPIDRDSFFWCWVKYALTYQIRGVLIKASTVRLLPVVPGIGTSCAIIIDAWADRWIFLRKYVFLIATHSHIMKTVWKHHHEIDLGGTIRFLNHLVLDLGFFDQLLSR